MNRILSPLLVLSIFLPTFVFQPLSSQNTFKDYQKPAAVVTGTTCLGSAAVWYHSHKQAQKIENQLKSESLPENAAELVKKLDEIQKRQKLAKRLAIGTGAVALILFAINYPFEDSEEIKPDKPKPLACQTHRYPFINNILYDDDVSHLKGIKKWENGKISIAIPLEENFELKDYEKEFDRLISSFKELKQKEDEIQDLLDMKMKETSNHKIVLEKFRKRYLHYLNKLFKEKSPYKAHQDRNVVHDSFDVSDPSFYLAKLKKWISDCLPEAPQWFYEHHSRLWILYFEFIKEKNVQVKANKALKMLHLLKTEILFALSRSQSFLLKNEARLLEEELGIFRNLQSEKLKLFYDDQALFPLNLKATCIQQLINELSNPKNSSISANNVPSIFDQIPSDIIVQIIYQLLISPHIMPAEQIRKIIDGLKQKWTNNPKHSKELEQIIEYEKWLLERCSYHQLPIRERSI